MNLLTKLLLIPVLPIIGFGGPDPPAVQQVNTSGRDANEAKAAADAAELERRRLAKERGQAASILGGEQYSPQTTGKKSLLSGIA